MERKEFLKKSLAVCGLSLIPIGIFESCSKQSYSGPSNVNFTVDLSNSGNAALAAAGGSLVANGVIIIHIGGSVYHAFSATCTHAGCTLGYSSGTIICPCHGGTYSPNTGAVTGGPPPSGLTAYTVTQSGTVLTIKS
jgi:Rieske Fe-S protein